MISTAVLLLLTIGSLAVSLLVWGLFLYIGLRWAKVRDITRRRLVVATLLNAVLQILLLAAAAAWPSHAELMALGGLVTTVFVAGILIKSIFRTTFRRALQAWLPTLVAPVLMLAGSMLFIRPLFFQAYYSPTNAMAPTLLGEHGEIACPECGGPAFHSPLRDEYASYDSPQAICEDHFHLTQPDRHSREVIRGDRFIVAKFLRPRRWDVIVFRLPEDPSILYVMRLIGLPGEEITIKDGLVWADGEELIPPESLRGIEYLAELPHMAEFPGGQDALWGSPSRPAKLGDDEYFVLEIPRRNPGTHGSGRTALPDTTHMPSRGPASSAS